MTAAPFHSFSSLVLTVGESALGDIRTDHRFELRATSAGAEVWRSTVLHSGEQACESPERLVGWLSSRQVIELLEEIERSGLYEALPKLGLVDGRTDPDASPRVSMQLHSKRERRDLIEDVPADEASIRHVVRAIRAAIANAEERALSVAG